ncbi:hypothetical protein CH76_01790 [Lysinibacillus sp. BF-4]|uniref:recombinase family protein n=1 Tax=Lysinibacillus sp. BF-4 TaxID=1473546 RepID=UPI0005025889|nr:recombinase family protein [Lysinibacillus sp. BF-4]KFL44565.1 hypothetical protein CH76_01790 [Lysinibacillus sp. BF-4]
MSKHNVAIYIRVSTKLQEDRYSLPAQRHELTKYAEQQGWHITKIYEDVDSGANYEKAGLTKLLDAVDDGFVDIVLVTDQDRLSRLDTVNWELLKGVLRDNGVKIAEPGNIVDLTNEDDEFFSDLKNLFAQRERRAIKRRMTRGLKQYTREGKIYGRQADEYIYDASTNSVTINEEHAWVISYIDDLFVNKNLSINQIASRLNKISKTPNGGTWQSQQVSVKLNAKCYHGILERRFGSDIISVPNVYPKLRTKAVYEAIQARINKRYREYPQSKHAHALRALKYRCPKCNYYLSIGFGYQNGQTVNAYLKHNNYFHHKACSLQPSIHTDRITRPLFQAIKSILKDEELAEKYLAVDFSKDKKELNTLKKVNTKLKSRLQKTKGKLDKLIDLYMDGHWSKQSLDTKRYTIEQEIKSLEDEVQAKQSKITMIEEQRYNYDSFIRGINLGEEYLAIIDNIENELTESEKADLLGSLINEAELRCTGEDQYEMTFAFNNKLGFDLKFDIKVDDYNVVAARQLRERQYKRYIATQQLLNKQSKPISFMQLKRMTGLNAETLRKDEKRFGKYNNLLPGRASDEKRKIAVAIIKECLAEDIKMSSYKIADRAKINQGTVLKYIKKYNLR